MRDAERQTCIAATVTLELGIDIGRLDQVLQLNATHSVSSFVQRLGRSGRRGAPSRMFFYSRETKPDSAILRIASLGICSRLSPLSNSTLKRWISRRLRKLPFSLLYHQTMSTLARRGIGPARLAVQVLSLAPFAQVSQEQYRTFLLHLIEIKHLERMETGTLVIGLQGEKIVNNYRFYATFEDETGFRVVEKTREIGTVPSAPAPETTIQLGRFYLAGGCRR